MFLKYQIFVVGGGKPEENIDENFLLLVREKLSKANRFDQIKA